MLGTKSFAIVFGYDVSNKLIYGARTWNGFTPATRLTLFKTFNEAETRGMAAGSDEVA